MTVSELVRAYRQLGMEEISESTRVNNGRVLELFANALGQRLVSQVRGIDISSWLAAKESWKSPWTFNRVLGTVRRLFNWGLEQDLLPTGRNPTARIKKRTPRSQRLPMSDEHFAALLRNASPHYRRVLIFLKMTGARPKEMATIKWKDVRLEQGRVVLAEHKNARKTGKPRVIPLVPPLVKMLVWMRSHRQASCAGIVERLLLENGGRMAAGKLAHRLRAYGVTHHALHRARMVLGVQRVLIDPPPPKLQYFEYRLPTDYRQLPEPAEHDWVFVNGLGNPFTRSCLTLYIMRLRRRAHVPPNISLYCLRHRFAFQGIKNKVNLKLLSVAMGHSDVRMTEHYIYDAGLGEEVQDAALQANFGQSIQTIEKALQAPRRLVEIPIAPPVDQIPTVAEFLPSRAGLERPRPQVPVPGDGQATANPMETLVHELLQRLRPPRGSGPAQPVVGPGYLTPAMEASWNAYLWAINRQPALATALDREVFHFLEGSADCPFKLPVGLETFRRYLSAARLFHDCRRRELHPRQEAPSTGGPQP